MSDQIFISYRRDDAAYVTGHINDLLRKEFGDDAVFTDVDNIALGVDFRAVLDEIISQCQVLLAVIGSEWLTIRNQEGELRLQDPGDFVRIEIESALQRNIPVIPLLVAGAKMPAPEELPESLQALAFRNGIPIRPAPDFSVDMARLIRNLRRHMQVPSEAPKGSAPASSSDRPSRDSEAPKFSVLVDDEDRARHQAELGIGKSRAKRWGLGLVAVVAAAAGAAWYYADRIPWIAGPEAPPEPIATIHTEAVTGTEAGAARVADTPDTGTMADAGTLDAVVPTDGTGTAMDAADGAAAIDTAAEATTDAAPGTPADAADIVGEVAATSADAAVDGTAALNAAAGPADEAALEPATQSANEPAAGSANASASPPASDAAAGSAAAGDAASTEMVEGEVVLSPVSQRKAEISELIGEGIRLAAIGDHDGAIRIFDEAIEIDTELAFGYRQRAASYRSLGQYEAAIKDYDEAIRLNPDDVIAYYNRAVSYFALEDYSAAIADLGAVIEFDPEHIDAYLKRADAYEAMGNVEAAQQDRALVEEFQSAE